MLCTCHWAIFHRITENSSQTLMIRMGSAQLTSSVCLACNWGMMEISRFLHSSHLTAPPFLLLESDIHVFNFSLLQVEPLLLVPPTFFFFFLLTVFIYYLDSCQFSFLYTKQLHFSPKPMFSSSLLLLTILLWNSSNWTIIFLTS